ncbi:hairy-related 3 [Lampris incognitus]|uniref:hairy-related 3 n=1 Tax=Lampris incognitus TaxID=2546036 RepID=UPI0024B55E6E|nr:hairy-related 3 [Lampris incognitus]
MVAASDSAEKPKAIAGNKVSKPLMEKKRRARINKCLDQLKSLLENYYTNNIRKRKLEKADILELTVKHLRSLQKVHSSKSTFTRAESSDFQAGFRSCLASVNQYLMTADNVNGRDRWTLSRLSDNLCYTRRREEGSSTADSDPEPQAAAMRRLLPPKAVPASGKAPVPAHFARCWRALKPRSESAGATSHSPLAKGDGTPPQGVAVTAVHTPQDMTPRVRSSMCASVSRCSNDAASSHTNVWRPW